MPVLDVFTALTGFASAKPVGPTPGELIKPGGHDLEANVFHGQRVEVVGRTTATEISQPGDQPRLTVVGLETVLVVDADEAARNLATSLLRSAGYRVLAAARGAAALTLLDYHRGRLDLLLTNTLLPDMSGGELARQVLENRPGLQVLFADDVDAGRVVEGHFIAKPYTSSSLTQKVRDILDLQRRPKVA